MAFQNALKQYISSVDIDYAKGNKDFFVAFEGSFGNKHVTPRTLTSRYLGNLVCVEGIVTKCKYSKEESEIDLLYRIVCSIFDFLFHFALSYVHSNFHIIFIMCFCF